MRIKDDKPHILLMRLVIFLFAAATGPLIGGFIDCQAQPIQQPPTNRGQNQPLNEAALPNAIAESKVDYRIGPGDVIDIKIDRAPELSGVFRVTAAGTIHMNYLGRIEALQKTPEEVARLITDGLRGRYLKNPRVTVAVTQINSHTFFIQGAVNRPGAYQIEGKPSLLKLITVAGGLKESHGTTAFIIREVKQPNSDPELKLPKNDANTGESSSLQKQTSLNSTSDARPDKSDSEVEREEMYELIRVSISGLFRGDFDKNMYIEPGSIINIPPADVFFVSGEVHAPGSFLFKEGTTLKQAISLAQGTTFKASSNSGIIFREDPVTRKRQELKIDIAAVMNGKKEDIPILANDIIIVPNSRFKSVSQTMLTAFGLSVVRMPRF